MVEQQKQCTHKEKGIQKELLSILLDYVLQREVSKDGESMLIYFMLNVEDRDLIETAYQEILMSGKKRLLPAMFAIKGEKTERLQELFDLLDRGDIAMLDFRGYFNYLSLRNYNVKYVAGRLLDYGAEGAAMVLTHCYNLLFGDQELDSEYLFMAAWVGRVGIQEVMESGTMTMLPNYTINVPLYGISTGVPSALQLSR